MINMAREMTDEITILKSGRGEAGSMQQGW